MNLLLKCEQCEKQGNLVIGTNPFQPSENIWLCNDCQFLEFSKLNNVKSFDASKIYCEADENLKIDELLSRLWENQEA